VTPGGDVLGWCDFSVVIPQGDAVSLSLTYRGGSTFQEGGEFSRISVSLAHGAPWDKPVGRVDLGIQLSKWARRNVKVVSPASRVLRFERLTWSGNDVTPGSFGPVVIDYGMDDRWPGAGWVRRAVDVRARTGAPQDPGTASPVTTGRADEWCVRRRDAEGRYELEVTMSAAALPGLDCKVLDVEVTPGPGSPAPNRLLERARFEGCSSPGSGFDFDLTGSRSGGWPPPTRPGDRIGAASEVAVPPGSPLRDELACVRLAGHLSGTEPGSEEVCIGGLRPRVYCRAEGRPQKPAAGVRSTRPHVPACWTPLVKACAARINERLSDVLQARPGAWPHLQETCRECAQPWQGVADPLAWKRCEVAVGLRSVGGALDLTRLASELRHRLTEAQEDLQVTLLCLDEASCPP